jgi:hypothetical protein
VRYKSVTVKVVLNTKSVIIEGSRTTKFWQLLWCIDRRGLLSALADMALHHPGSMADYRKRPGSDQLF